MDEQVLRSLIKWPNVPHCFGWLALDRRGQWRMRDEFAQANQLAGSVIQHVALNEFISRNYACDSLGRYFFQNGPQRVFITLDATPFIARIIPSQSGPQLLTQCGTEINRMAPCVMKGAISISLEISCNHFRIKSIAQHLLRQNPRQSPFYTTMT
jgi:Protein of unknown function (DUF2946)